jgi:Txe/YoeB family toxin of Txe-Axe toxin-antitoxin module
MISRTLARFWRMYQALPPQIRRQAREAYRRFQQDPSHPSLRFHPLHGYPDYWSARITLSYRAVCRREGNTLYWFWIGSHADFDRDFG